MRHRIDGGPGTIYRGAAARKQTRNTTLLLTALLLVFVGSLAMLTGVMLEVLGLSIELPWSSLTIGAMPLVYLGVSLFPWGRS